MKQKYSLHCVILVSWREWSQKVLPTRFLQVITLWAKVFDLHGNLVTTFLWVLLIVKPAFGLSRLKQWFSSGGMFDCHNSSQGVCVKDVWWIEARDAAPQSTVHKTAPAPPKN